MQALVFSKQKVDQNCDIYNFKLLQEILIFMRFAISYSSYACLKIYQFGLAWRPNFWPESSSL